MIPAIRKAFNDSFRQERYRDFLDELDRAHPGQIEFRVAETAVFVPAAFRDKLFDACESIVDVIADPRFQEWTKDAVPPQLNVPGEMGRCEFIAFDFGVCTNEEGEHEPQLIEMQGFPSLSAYQVLLDDVFRRHFDVPAGFHTYLNRHDRDSYLDLFREIVLGGHAPQHVILLEIFPERQKTRIDFYCTEDYTGIHTVCLTKLIREGKKLFYLRNGKKTEVRRIYNRVIFDDLFHQEAAAREKGKIFFEELDVEWAPHPNWFYRISKYTIPFLRHPYVPATYFLDQVKQLPDDLEHYVLKPLFSFAGQGVVIDIVREELEKIPDPQNWILQRKVRYAGAIETPDEPAKAEIRIFYFWKPGTPRPVAVNNLARLSKGKMIGVRYNKDRDWVGGSLCYFET
ncbi:MAG TPA: hypothetical protein VEB63_06090 [Chitinophagaceae bacterium]|nr:hypothetical protein [Chitinophagaceae bacterium]